MSMMFMMRGRKAAIPVPPLVSLYVNPEFDAPGDKELWPIADTADAPFSHAFSFSSASATRPTSGVLITNPELATGVRRTLTYNFAANHPDFEIGATYRIGYTVKRLDDTSATFLVAGSNAVNDVTFGDSQPNCGLKDEVVEVYQEFVMNSSASTVTFRIGTGPTNVSDISLEITNAYLYKLSTPKYYDLATVGSNGVTIPDYDATNADISIDFFGRWTETVQSATPCYFIAGSGMSAPSYNRQTRQFISSSAGAVGGQRFLDGRLMVDGEMFPEDEKWHTITWKQVGGTATRIGGSGADGINAAWFQRNVSLKNGGSSDRLYRMQDGWSANPEIVDSISSQNGTAVNFTEQGWQYVIPVFYNRKLLTDNGDVLTNQSLIPLQHDLETEDDMKFDDYFNGVNGYYNKLMPHKNVKLASPMLITSSSMVKVLELTMTDLPDGEYNWDISFSSANPTTNDSLIWNVKMNGANMFVSDFVIEPKDRTDVIPQSYNMQIPISGTATFEFFARKEDQQAPTIAIFNAGMHVQRVGFRNPLGT